jgi:hypothetical protein
MLPLRQSFRNVLVSCTLKNIFKILCASPCCSRCAIVSPEGPGALSWPSFCSHKTLSYSVGGSLMWMMCSGFFDEVVEVFFPVFRNRIISDGR